MERLETLCHWQLLHCTVAGDMERTETVCQWSGSALYCGTRYVASLNTVPLVSQCIVLWHVIRSVLKHCATGKAVHCTVARDMERLETLCHWSASAVNCGMRYGASGITVPPVSLCIVLQHAIWSVLKHCATGQLVCHSMQESVTYLTAFHLQNQFGS